MNIDLSALAQEYGEETVKRAIQQATPEIIAEMTRKVYYQVSRDYYDEYSPKRYKRTYDLLNIWDVQGTANGLNISFEGIADSDMLSQHESGSELHETGTKWYAFPTSWERGGDDNGMPQSEWIYSNFKKGIHPGYRLVSDEILGRYVENYSVYGEGIDSSYNRNLANYSRNNNIEKFIKKYL